MRAFLLVAFLLSTVCRADEPPELTSVAQLRSLSPEKADRRLPVRLRGVVTYAESDYDLLYVQDETGGTYVSRPLEVVEPVGFDRFLEPGDDVELVGVTNRGKFIPHLDAGDAVVQVRLVGRKSLPSPLRPRRGEVYDPKLHNQWVEVEAFAATQRHSRRWLRLSLVVGGRSMEALILGPWETEKPPDLTNSDLRIHGVYGATFNDQRELTGANVLVPSLDQIQVIDHGLNRAFASPPVPIQEVRQFRPAVFERTHVEGVVTWSAKGRGFSMSDGSAVTWVDTADGTVPAVGSPVGVVGFPSIDGDSLRLRDAVVRARDIASQPPEPLSLAILEAGEPGLHGRLVRMEGKIVDSVTLPNTRLLVLSNGSVSYEARFASSGSNPSLPSLGSWVSVTGVFERLPKTDDEGTATFRLLLRDSADVQLLRAPSWWTPRRIAWLAAGLAMVMALSFAWAVMLRRRVATQTKIIAEQIESQRIAEERSRIGSELHDTLEQCLTGVALQVDTAAAQLPDSASDARDSLNTASAMVAHTRQEARRSVWNLKAPALQRDGLPAALADLLTTMNSPQTEISLVAPTSWNRLAGNTEFHLLRIAQEATANAVKHADATRIDIALTNGDAGVEMTIRDNGRGFDPDSPPQDGRLHFGITGMRERAGKVNAEFHLNTQPGKGTEVTIRLPKVPAP